MKLLCFVASSSRREKIRLKWAEFSMFAFQNILVSSINPKHVQRAAPDPDSSTPALLG